MASQAEHAKKEHEQAQKQAELEAAMQSVEPLIPTDKVYAKSVPGKGRGVFARKPIKSGELIERCPAIRCPDTDWERLEKTAMKDYYLNFGDDATAIILGFGSLYNHSSNPNAKTVRRVQERVVEYWAIKDIQQDEEIVWTYQCGAWFDVVDATH